MKRQMQILCFIISGISLVGGLSDILIQLLEGEEVQWRIPLILIGAGAGIPIFMFPFYEPATKKDEELNYDENDLSKEYQDSPGFLSDSRNGDSSGSDYDSSYDTTD